MGWWWWCGRCVDDKCLSTECEKNLKNEAKTHSSDRPDSLADPIREPPTRMIRVKFFQTSSKTDAERVSTVEPRSDEYGNHSWSHLLRHLVLHRRTANK